MAKLSAHGFEVARITREGDRDPSTQTYLDGTPVANPVVHERVEFSFRSDGHVLRKFTTTWQDGHRHDYGWKLYVKLRKGGKVPSTQAILGRAERMAAAYSGEQTFKRGAVGAAELRA
jgi:hypothetical protein